MWMTLLSFGVALCVLIAIHEYGHYRMALACGVKVLRFSIGFGKPVWRFRPHGSETEFVLSALPLGGYVRMLDEREAAVPLEEQHRAFNRQSLAKRAAIVAAGPAANLLLAVVLYSAVAWVGSDHPLPVLSSPTPGSVMAQAGLQGGERVTALQVVGGRSAHAPATFEDLRWHLAQAALQGETVLVRWQRGAQQGEAVLNLEVLQGVALNAQAWEHLGLVAPWSAPIVGDVLPGGAAARAGLQAGDTVLRMGEVPIRDAVQLRRAIRMAAQTSGALTQRWYMERDGQKYDVRVELDRIDVDGEVVGRLGAYVGAQPAMVQVRKGVWQGLESGVAKTWELSVVSVQMMGQMLIGQASLQNLSGPLTIADYAGKSASLGWIQYITFLALISVSLGVLNLLPLPVLDGGHLMYYLWEGVTGHPVSDVWMERLQRVGISLLLVMMSIAFFNDISRIWG